MAKREVPFSPIDPLEDDEERSGGSQTPRGFALHETRPLNEYQALLEAAPFEDPDLSRAELLPLRDVVADAIDDVLTERERFVFDLIATERRSRRETAAMLSLSKSQVDRIYHRACALLRDALQDDPTIKEYLTR
jgi:RNA polymerase sigma factor (sigma-70 family)